MDFTLPSSVAIARMSGVGNGGTRKLDASDGEAKVQVWQFLGKAALINGGFDKAKEMAGIEGLVVGDMFSESEIEDFLGCFEVPMRNFVTAVSGQKSKRFKTICMHTPSHSCFR